MHTPGHVLLNLALLGNIVGHEGAVVAGALVPDVPIVVLYLRERLRGTPTETIWSVCYQRKHWLAVIHGAHSTPGCAWDLYRLAHARSICDVLFLQCIGTRSVRLPTARRGCPPSPVPLSNYRFISPWSYWDHRHHGRVVALIEAVVAVTCSGFIYFSMSPRWTQIVPRPLLGTLLIAINLWYAQNYYRNFVRS